MALIWWGYGNWQRHNQPWQMVQRGGCHLGRALPTRISEAKRGDRFLSLPRFQAIYVHLCRWQCSFISVIDNDMCSDQIPMQTFNSHLTASGNLKWTTVGNHRQASNLHPVHLGCKSSDALSMSMFQCAWMGQSHGLHQWHGCQTRWHNSAPCTNWLLLTVLRISVILLSPTSSHIKINIRSLTATHMLPSRQEAKSCAMALLLIIIVLSMIIIILLIN